MTIGNAKLRLNWRSWQSKELRSANPLLSSLVLAIQDSESSKRRWLTSAVEQQRWPTQSLLLASCFGFKIFCSFVCPFQKSFSWESFYAESCWLAPGKRKIATGPLHLLFEKGVELATPIAVFDTSNLEGVKDSQFSHPLVFKLGEKAIECFASVPWPALHSDQIFPWPLLCFLSTDFGMTYQSHKAFDCFQYFPVRTRWLLVSEASRQLLQKRSKRLRRRMFRNPQTNVWRAEQPASALEKLKRSGAVSGESCLQNFVSQLQSRNVLQQHHSFLVSKLVLLPVVQSQMGLPVGALSWKAPGQWWLRLLPQWLTSLVTKTPANIGNYCWTLTRSIWTKLWGVVVCILWHMGRTRCAIYLVDGSFVKRSWPTKTWLVLCTVAWPYVTMRLTQSCSVCESFWPRARRMTPTCWKPSPPSLPKRHVWRRSNWRAGKILRFRRTHLKNPMLKHVLDRWPVAVAACFHHLLQGKAKVANRLSSESDHFCSIFVFHCGPSTWFL